MLNILKNFDDAEKGKKTSTGTAAKNEMKTILESINAISQKDSTVEECGMAEMPAMSAPVSDPVTMNVSMNARGVDAIQDLLDLMGNAKAHKMSSPIVTDPGMDMMGPKEPSMSDLIKISSMSDMGDEPKMTTLDKEEESYDNEPDEKYDDHETMIHDLSGGINRKKKQFKATEPGDNPMAVESIKARLMAALAEKKTTEGKYKSDAQRKAIHANKDKMKK